MLKDTLLDVYDKLDIQWTACSAAKIETKLATLSRTVNNINTCTINRLKNLVDKTLRDNPKLKEKLINHKTSII